MSVWKPGDVAWRTYGDGGGLISLAVTCHDRSHGEGLLHWHHSTGGWDRIDPSRHGLDYRPLVVIDPGSDADVDRIVDACVESDAAPFRARVQAALRSLLAPPRPDEPLGLGAVVEDNNGHQWVRVAHGFDGYEDWKQSSETEPRVRYANIAVVKVLSEGVTA